MSKYRKVFESAYKVLREKETPADKLVAVRDTIEPLIKMLEEAENPETLAEQLLALV